MSSADKGRLAYKLASPCRSNLHRRKKNKKVAEREAVKDDPGYVIAACQSSVDFWLKQAVRYVEEFS